MDPMTPSGPNGLSSPKAVSTPPPNSESPARVAQGRPGFKPSISINWLVPSRPGPPKAPNSFWAPWPAISDPCAKRTINGARSFTLEVFPLEDFTLEVFTFTPSVAFLKLATLVQYGRGRLPRLSISLQEPPRLPIRGRGGSARR